MERFSDRFILATYENEPTILIGLHDGRLREETAVEMSESLAARLQLIGKAYKLHHTSQIDIYEDASFNNVQCEGLIEELNFVQQTVNDSLLHQYLVDIIALARKCILSNNRRIKVYVAGN